MKLDELRKECEKRNLPTTGKKKELEERLIVGNTVTQDNSETLVLNVEPAVKFTLGDCLKLLEPVENDSVQMIYLDPPFNSDRNYILSDNSPVGFSDTWEKDEYPKFLKDLVEISHKKLAKNGTLYFHISAEKMFFPETILRTTFKIVQPIFWKRCRAKNNVKTKLGTTIDVIFKCTKQAEATFNLVYQAKDEKYLEGSFKNKDEKGNYALGHLMTEPTKKGYEYSFTFGDRTFNPPSGWRTSKEELEKLKNENRIHLPKGKTSKLYKKIYLHENPGKVCSDLWDDIHSIGQGKELRNYPTAKPIKLLERMIEISTNKGDLVI